jgi:hypothetical protein
MTVTVYTTTLWLDLQEEDDEWEEDEDLEDDEWEEDEDLEDDEWEEE